MALDKQRILGELGSVMTQLQNADCGCLGKLFGSPQQTPASNMANPLPTCGGCRRGCCHGHGYNNSNYNPNPMPSQNMSSMVTQDANAQQPMSGNMYGFGPQIVSMMNGNTKQQDISGQGHGGLTSPMVIDAPQSPNSKVGLTPFAQPAQGQFDPSMDLRNVTGPTQQQFMPQTNSNAVGNLPGATSWPQQNMPPPGAHQMANAHGNMHGQHSQGIAKFNQMFPGVKQGMGGDLGFDPMAIAMQMNPDNHLQTAMDTMNKVINNNTGITKMMNQTPVLQPIAQAGDNFNVSPVPNAMAQEKLAMEQNNQGFLNQIANQQIPVDPNVMHPAQVPANPSNTGNIFGQPIPQQNQQVYAANQPTSANQNALQSGYPQLTDQHQLQLQQYGQQPTDLNSASPNLPTTYEEIEENQIQTSPGQATYPNEAPAQQMIKEPIIPADNSRNAIYMPVKQQNNYVYNTLGQPVEMLPAKLYHPKEPSLPQTLSPQPVPAKFINIPPRGVNVKATVSKTSIVGNRPTGRIPSRNNLQQIYNQYKGSQSFTQQNVIRPSGNTHSDGRLNIPQANIPKSSLAPMERVGGDTVVTNPPSNALQVNKGNRVIEQIGDVPVAKPGGDTLPVKDAPVPIKKSRNGLQDVVFSSYPTSTAWSFHGHGRHELTQAHRYRNRPI